MADKLHYSFFPIFVGNAYVFIFEGAPAFQSISIVFLPKFDRTKNRLSAIYALDCTSA